MSFDSTDIGAVVNALYTVLSGPAGERDWTLQDQAFHPHARLMRTGADEFGVSWMKTMTLQEYRENVALFFQTVPFYEAETSRRVEQFGNIAHVWSTYEERRDPRAREIERRGVNSIQLYLDPQGHWRIMSVIWDNEREGVALP